MKSFKEFNFKPYINSALKRINFIKPTPVQEVVIPLALKQESLIVESATGSGKTHAFMLPILQKINEQDQNVQAVIISPTRELAMQLYNVVMELIKDCEYEITVARAIGGSDREAELRRYAKSQPQIIIGTIGRITDLALDSNALKIYSASMVVIDEADMIFEEKEMLEVDRIMGVIQGNPQFLVFSATIPKGLRTFLNKYLDKAKVISLDEEEFTARNIAHVMLQCKAKAKEQILLDLIKVINPYLALIFVNTKEGVDQLAIHLAEHGLKVGKLHGDMEDRARKQMLKRIQSLEYQYVVASDIASRGIDIQGVSHVINFELPKDVEFYIHRTGRTARFTNTGTAYTLYAYEDDSYIKMLQAKGLKPTFYQIKDGALIETSFKKRVVKSSITKQIEEEIHQKTLMPKKVKPGYKKKRKEAIEKEIKRVKRNRIRTIYRERAKKERIMETRGERNENR